MIRSFGLSMAMERSGTGSGRRGSTRDPRAAAKVFILSFRGNILHVTSGIPQSTQAAILVPEQLTKHSLAPTSGDRHGDFMTQ